MSWTAWQTWWRRRRGTERRGLRQTKVAGEYVRTAQAMDRKYTGGDGEGRGPPMVGGGADRAGTGGGPQPRRGGATGLSFACRQSVELLVEKFGKLVGEQGYADMGYRTPPDVVASGRSLLASSGAGWRRGGVVEFLFE